MDAGEGADLDADDSCRSSDDEVGYISDNNDNDDANGVSHKRGSQYYGEGIDMNSRTDLERMTSGRNFFVGMPGDGRGDVRQQQSSLTSTISNATTGVELPEEVGQSDKVVDFFRQVNKDTHLLKRMGDGMRGCGGALFRVFASCLRQCGLGNPASSVEKMAFDLQDPVDISDRSHYRRKGCRTDPGRRPSVLEEFGIDDDAEEDDEEVVDAREISVQRKKVDDLGELPALNWTNVSRNLLLCTLVCGALLLSTLSPRLDTCVQAGSHCLRHYMYAICVGLGSYFVIELLAKMLAGFFKWTHLLHVNNKVWIFIKLHKDVSLLIWSGMILGLWLWFESTELVIQDHCVVESILGFFLAYMSVKIVKKVCEVEMAHRYMWRPYLERARTSIWAQYVIFMMTDHAMGVPTKDVEGQALALGFTKTKKVDEDISLYTVGKAIGFVHANALKHPLGPGRPGTDKGGMINSKTGARLFGELLFDALMIKFNEGDNVSREENQNIPDVAGEVMASHYRSREKFITRHPSAEQNKRTLPRPLGSTQAPSVITKPMTTPVGNGLCDGLEHDAKSPLRRRLSSVMEVEEASSRGIQGESKQEGPAALPAAKTTSNTYKEEFGRWPPCAAPLAETPAAAAAPMAAEDCSSAATPTACRGSVAGAPREKESGEATCTRTGSVGQLRRVLSAAGRKGLTLRHFRQMTSKAVALEIMELFEVPPDGIVSRKIFVDFVKSVFVQRRSLQLTLGDYEAILKKVGYLFTMLSAVVVFFIALRILGVNIGSLVITWLSLAVAFSFLFGSSASAFFESIIFVFVTKAYDVGDPVFFVDDSGNESWYIVTGINMLTTVFRRWDGQATLLANNILAKKAIRNQWRSSPFVHSTTIAVSMDTPMEKLDSMKAGISAGMRRGRHKHRHGEGGLMPDTVDYSVTDLADGNRLKIGIFCRQRESSADMGRRFRNANLFMKLITRECNKNGITYIMPTQPVVLGGKGGGLDAVHMQEKLFGGD